MAMVSPSLLAAEFARLGEECRKVLDAEYPELADKILPALPDEAFRRVGQSVAAASLPAGK